MKTLICKSHSNLSCRNRVASVNFIVDKGQKIDIVPKISLSRSKQFSSKYTTKLAEGPFEVFDDSVC